MFTTKYEDIVVEVIGQIGIVRFNRPKSLNSFGGKMVPEAINAIRELNEHPTTVFTVLTGTGRFFCSGADVKDTGLSSSDAPLNTTAEKKLAFLARFLPGLEMLRSMIDHKKVFILALNGPGVGAGATWFQGAADIVVAAEGAYLQVPFSALGLVPEYGSAVTYAQSIGVHRANDFLMFGKKLTVEELQEWGMINRLFPAKDFHKSVVEFLKEQLAINDGKSMMEAKRLQNAGLRDARMIAVINAMDALAERFVEGAPLKRFELKKAELIAKSKGKSSKL